MPSWIIKLFCASKIYIVNSFDYFLLKYTNKAPRNDCFLFEIRIYYLILFYYLQFPVWSEWFLSWLGFSIFNFNCEHFLLDKPWLDLIWLLYIVEQKQKCLNLKKNKIKLDICLRLIFEILIIHKRSLGSREVPHRIWVRSVHIFGPLLDTQIDTQTDKQSIYINVVSFVLRSIICTM